VHPADGSQTGNSKEMLYKHKSGGSELLARPDDCNSLSPFVALASAVSSHASPRSAADRRIFHFPQANDCSEPAGYVAWERPERPVYGRNRHSARISDGRAAVSLAPGPDTAGRAMASSSGARWYGLRRRSVPCRCSRRYAGSCRRQVCALGDSSASRLDPALRTRDAADGCSWRTHVPAPSSSSYCGRE
jgi:hypothetical protein